MGWPAHNPELYDRICLSGIMEKLESPSNIGGNSFHDDEVEEAMIEAMECYPIKLALCDWASKEIADAEASHFADMVDDEMEKHETHV